MGNNFSVESPSCDQPFLPFLCGKRKYLYNLEENLEALHKVMEDLNAIRNDLLKRVSKEEAIGLQGLPEVKGWIFMVEEIEPKANRLLDESISEIQRLSRYGYCSLIPASTYRYSEEVLKTLKGVKNLKSTGVFEVVVHKAHPPLVIKMPPIQLTVSQQNLFERACNFLEEKTVGTLGIYGKGGVGKTTLLTKIKNKFLEEAFGLVIFVVVGSEEVESIQEEIGNRLGLKWTRETKEEKAAEILMTLEGKRFLLLLDGIQREVNLEEIGVPYPSRENGCKIVFTTQSREACDESKWVDAKVEITCLSSEEAWDLFQETVGENTLRSHQDIPMLARVVASTCRGLPLALNLIGGTMSRKRTVGEWRYTIHVLASSTAEFSDMKDGAFPILKYIYDNMSDENIRLCFLYCALFPENCDIRKEDLVNYWIGEGILAKEDREKAEIQGYEIISDLVRMRLLMEGGNGYYVKMHGMVREMALWIASGFGRRIEHFVVVGGERIHQLPMVNDWGMVRRMSVMSTQIQNISYSLQCSELTTLVFRRNRHLKWISGAFFRWMTSLVVLDLSFNIELAELPEEVSSLVLLRFLNLSWTCIKGLPRGLKELKSLIHLDLDYTSNLQEGDVIASLLNLQVLRLFQSVPMDLKLMEDIQLLKSLKELSLTVRESSVLQRLLSIHQLASSIQRLHLTETTIADGEILSLNAMFDFCELDILGCNIPEITIDWRSTIQRETVHLGNIEEIPQFRNIRTVNIHRCECLRELTWLLLAPSIRDLRLSECPLVEEVISKRKAMAELGHMNEQPFQNLTELVLDDLPKLESIYWTPLPFPILEYLEIRRCPKLKRLPFNSESAIGNQVETKIEKQWINVVEWEDEATKQRFSHFNNRDFPQMAEDPKMDGLTSESHPIQNIDFPHMAEDPKMDGLTSESHPIQNIDFPHMAEDPKMDGLTLGSYPIQNIDLSWTTDSQFSLSDSKKQDESKQKEESPQEKRLDQMAFEALMGINGKLITKSWIASKSAYRTEHYIKEEAGGIVFFAFRPSFSAKDLFATANKSPFGEIKMKRVEFPCMRSIGNDVDATVNEAFLKNLEVIIGPKTSFHASVQSAVKREQQIVFTGHSSGGATAILATVWYLEKYFIRNPNVPEPRCVTFGAPLVGDYIFKHALGRENWSRFFVNFVTRFDIVPRIMLARKSSIEQTLPYVLAQLDPTRFSTQESDERITEFYTMVMRDTSTVAYQAVNQLIGNGEAFLETLSSFLELSPYRPVGSFVLSTEKRLVVVNNSDAILQMLFYSSQSSDEQEWSQIPFRSIKDHHGYEELVQSIGILLLNHLDVHNLPLLNDLGVSTRARQCVHAALEAEKQRVENQKKIERNKHKIVERLTWIVEEYKPKCQDHKNGYYDSFKLSNEENDFKANVKRVELAGIFDEVLGLVKKGHLPDGFEGSRDWIKLATQYRRLFEPLDISNYHRHLKKEDTGPYMLRGRPNRYKYAQRGYEHEILKPTGMIAKDVFWSKVNDLKLGLQLEMQEILKISGSMCGSCFWAEVEELKGKPYEEVKVRVKTLEGLLDGWIKDEEVDEKEIYLEGSTFRRWWNTLPDNHKFHSPLRERMMDETRAT